MAKADAHFVDCSLIDNTTDVTWTTGNTAGHPTGTGTAITTVEELQKIGSFSATFTSAVGTIAAGETITYQTTRTCFVLFITYDTTTTGTIWWRWTSAVGNIANGNVCNHGTDTITINSVPESHLDDDYYLANDIDASATSTWFSGVGFIPIGYVNATAQMFSGTFDGCGYTISSLYRNGTDNGGLFGDFEGATIDNVILSGFDITTTGAACCLVNTASNATITNVSVVSPTIATGTQAGGMIGWNGGSGSGNTISDCSVTNADITSGTYSGLFASRCQGDYTDCFASGTITRASASTYAFGGFIGYIAGSYDSSFTRCECTGTIPAQLSASEYTNGGFTGSSYAVANYTDCEYLSTMNVLPFGGEDEIQTITAVGAPAPTGGSYSITFDGHAVTLGYHTTEAQAQAAFDAEFGTGVIEVDGDYPIAGNRTQKIYFRKTYSRTNVTTAVVDSSGLTGAGAPYSWTIATTNAAVYPTVISEPSGGTPEEPEVDRGSQTRTIWYPSDYSHLEGESLQVLADGAVHPNVTVTGGAITLNYSATNIHAGLGYTSKVQPMKIDGEVYIKRIVKLILNFFETLGGWFGESESKLYPITYRTAGDELNDSAELYTGYKEVSFAGGYNRTGDIWIEQTQPLPMNLIGMAIKVEELDD